MLLFCFSTKDDRRLLAVGLVEPTAVATQPLSVGA